MTWRQLMKLQGGAPLVLLFNDGGAGLLVGVSASRQVVFIKDPRAPQAEDPVPVDELRLAQAWSGDVILIRRERGVADEDAPFNFNWIARLVLKERRFLAAISWASIALSFLTIVSPLIVMVVINRVIQHHSLNTLEMVSIILAIAVLYEAMLSYARREITQVLATRLDAKLNLHIFNRLLALPLDFFESHPTGDTTHRIHEIYRVRGLSHRQAAGHLPRHVHVVGVAAGAVLAEPDFGVDIAGNLGGGGAGHPGVSAADSPRGRQGGAGRDREEHGPDRDRAWHPHRQIGRHGAGSEGGLGSQDGHCRTASPGSRDDWRTGRPPW